VQEFDKTERESLLQNLDEASKLFPQFALKKQNNELVLLGSGGFSHVYEMYNKEREERSYALKVSGFQYHTVDSTEFRDTTHIQWILCQESDYIMRILDAKEIKLGHDEEPLFLQCVLMEKLDSIIEKDRFKRVSLNREKLSEESEILKLALEIGQAIAVAHTNKFLHRDIKLENIFWNEESGVYQLGDFGIAKWAVDGNAETVVYTEGYGAPEIERRLYDSYNSRADMYSFGITLYLLLNDLKFPGSEGYYSNVEIQYNPDFVFPAPAHASESMARIIRKMCSYYPEERYNSMNEVIAELSEAVGEDAPEGLMELADLATETFKAEEGSAEANKETNIVETRAERKRKEKILKQLFIEDNIKYGIVCVLLFILLFKGLQTDTSMIYKWQFFALPIAVAYEALLQKLKEFNVIFGVIIVAFAAFSIYSVGFTIPHVILVLGVILAIPALTLSSAVSVGLWMLMEHTHSLKFLNVIHTWNLWWMVLILLVFTFYQYGATLASYIDDCEEGEEIDSDDEQLDE